VVIGEAKPDLRGKELIRKVEYEKKPDVRERGGVNGSR
jgi:hypothetical protein